jgi:hypothetical protein
MKRMMLVVGMAIALTLATLAPAVAKPSGVGQGAGDEPLPHSYTYICHSRDLWSLPGRDLYRYMHVEVRNHSSARITTELGSWNALIVDYRMSYWDTENDIGGISTKLQIPQAEANVSCYYDTFYSNPGWITTLQLRLGAGQLLQWMNAHWPGWDD